MPQLGDPSPVSADIVDSTRGRGRCVALTFDDGPHPPDTTALLGVLDAQGVTAAFGLWGDFVVEHPGIVRAIATAGHVLFNHSMHHHDMSGWPPGRIAEDLAETNAAIRAAVPDAAIDYFRAPFGRWGRTPEVAARMGMRPLGWRLDVQDWEPATADELTERLAQGVTPESVVLLHDGGGDRRATVAAVERFIPEFRRRGWTFDLPAEPGSPAPGHA
jgi:peptidoglycan-N-acetylglucosamine deacetylase